MGFKRSPMAPAFAEMMKSQRPADKPDTQVAAGWFITSGHDRLIWKGGGVLGYSAVHHDAWLFWPTAIAGR